MDMDIVSFTKSHGGLRRGRGGFTLVELLVVVVIIGILAAIAVPVYLNQRKAAWRASVESDVHNASLAIETAESSNGGAANLSPSSYPITDAGGSINGSSGISDNRVTVSKGNSLYITFSGNDYSITGGNSNLGDAVYTISSSTGTSEWGVSTTSAWTGAANASKSTLASNGSVIATNLILSPKPLASGWKVNDTDWLTVSDTPSGMLVRSTNASGNPAAIPVTEPTLPAGSYHVHANVSTTGTSWNDMAIGIWSTGSKNFQIYPSKITNGVIDADITIPADWGGSPLELKCPRDGSTTWSQLGIYTSSDWAAMQKVGVTWFDGDSVARR